MEDFPYFLFLSVYVFAWITYQHETYVCNTSVRCGLWYEEDSLRPPLLLARGLLDHAQHLRQGMGGPLLNATGCAPRFAVQCERVMLRFSLGASP